MRRPHLILILCGIAALTFAAVTLIALEGREVVVLRTSAADGHVRKTRTWVADADGDMWIEAANPDRPFLHDLRGTPHLELQRGGHIYRCSAAVMPNPEGHERIRSLLAAKYGWADGWIGRLTDLSESLALRLDCR